MGVVKRYNGTAWVTATVQERAAGAWTTATATVRAAGAWVTGGAAVEYTVGPTTVATEVDNGNANLLCSNLVTLDNPAEFRRLSFYVDAPAGQLYFAVYNDAGILVDRSNVFTPVAGWNTQPMIAPAQRPAGSYWLTYHPSSSALSFRINRSTGTHRFVNQGSFGVPPSTFPTSGVGVSPGNWSLYATVFGMNTAPPPPPPPPPAAPTITSISPNLAPAGPVTIAGTNFVAGATVSFSGAAATNVAVVNTTQVTCNAPAHADGAVNVTVTTSAGTSNAVTFTYQATPPPPPPGTTQIDGGPNYFGQFSPSLPTDPGFFPIGVWFEQVLSQGDIDLDKDVGLNTYVVLTANSNMNLVRDNGMFAIVGSGDFGGAGANPAVAGWFLADEIDMTRGPGPGYTDLQNAIAQQPNDNRFNYTNYGKGVVFWESDAEASRFVNEFQQVTSADIYWFTDPNVHGFSEGGRFLTGTDTDLTNDQTRRAYNYGLVVDEMRRLDVMDGVRRAIWNFVEVGWPFGESAAQGGRAILPAECRAAVWHSIIAGARGILYFNHSWNGPAVTQHALRDPAYAAVRAVVKATNAQIKALAPVLNSPTESGYASASTSVRAMTKNQGGKRWIFAGSRANVSSSATFTLTGVTTGTAVVEGENRTIPIVGGKFTDSFADGNAIHIYRID